MSTIRTEYGVLNADGTPFDEEPYDSREDVQALIADAEAEGVTGLVIVKRRKMISVTSWVPE